jgi:hypothetical protein
VPPEYAATGQIFAGWIARLLPQLSLWEGKSSGRTGDAEDGDLSFLKSDYASFLERHGLFEPSWQKPPLADTGLRFIIFFTDAIEDFGEYEVLLRGSPSVSLIDVLSCLEAGDGAPGSREVREYATVREEFRDTALEIEALLRLGVSAADIAVSVPDLEAASPYLEREFALRGIPAVFRAGKPLADTGAGRLFSLIRACTADNFSFASVKALLLDRMIPWKHPDLAGNLVDFGIRNHCVTSWNENGMAVDVWEEAFRTPVAGEKSDWRLLEWFRKLKSALTGLTGAKTFADIRTRYFAFRESFLDRERYAETDDAVVARCVDELNGLALLESAYHDCLPADPYAFFISHLRDRTYVAQSRAGGVSVFPYRVAAGTPYPHHFVLDASQGSTTVLYRQLSFLRQDKRDALNIYDTDASDSFFEIYRLSPRVTAAVNESARDLPKGAITEPCNGKPTAASGIRFSYSQRSVGGYRTPHGYFTAKAPRPELPTDPFADERAWYGGAGFPDRLYHSQTQGFSSWRFLDEPRAFSYLTGAYGARVSALSARIADRMINDGDIRVTQTDLNVFALCPARWFLSRLLAISEEDADAGLMNERNLGILYHHVLKEVYERILDTDGIFRKERTEVYRLWAEESAGNAAAEHAEFRGPLAAPLISTLVRRIADGVGGLIDRDAELLDGFIPEFLESELSFSFDGIRYTGTIDRISRRPSDNEIVLIDYKSGIVPTPKAYRVDDVTDIADCQIPMYVFLTERSPESPYRGEELRHAWFGDIRKADYRPVICDKDMFNHGGKRDIFTREEFEPAMESFSRRCGDFAEAVREARFTRPDNLAWTECAACDWRAICRYPWAVKP